MPQFVLLAHDYPAPHFDLMLEHANTLRTWRLTAIPQLNNEYSAESLGDHRLAYLDYEGPVSGNRGSVKRIDRGALEWITNSTDSAIVAIRGQLLIGRLELNRNSNGWTCCLKALLAD